MGVVKPNFFLVGAPRCGTTSMYAYLRSHPQIFMPETAKEPHYFAPEESLWYGKRIDDLETYLALFTGARDAVRIGEASTHYLASPSAANSIYAFNPQARILIMLRSPVDLLYSLYYHRRQTGKERHATFEQALVADTDEASRKPRYRIFGQFASQVQRYWDVFGPDAVQIILFDDLKSDVSAVYRQTLLFLDVDATFQPDFAPVNEHRTARLPLIRQMKARAPGWYRLLQKAGRQFVSSDLRQVVNAQIDQISLSDAPRPPMNPATRQQLQREFLPEMEQLSQMLNRDLTHWCRD